jgi:hypothetical protein
LVKALHSSLPVPAAIASSGIILLLGGIAKEPLLTKPGLRSEVGFGSGVATGGLGRVSVVVVPRRKPCSVARRCRQWWCPQRLVPLWRCHCRTTALWSHTLTSVAFYHRLTGFAVVRGSCHVLVHVGAPCCAYVCLSSGNPMVGLL